MDSRFSWEIIDAAVENDNNGAPLFRFPPGSAQNPHYHNGFDVWIIEEQM